MPFSTQFDQSNKADWTFAVSATDADTGADIDFTGATVSFKVKDENGAERLSASIGSGITLTSSTVLTVLFSSSTMQSLAPGSYTVGMIYSLNGSINQILTGSVAIYDGVASI